MNFFTQQDRARSSTRKLVFLFCCAVAVLITMTSFLIYALLFTAEANTEGAFNTEILFSDLFLKVGFGVTAVIVLGSSFRLMQLRGGGKVVAESMQGRLLNNSSADIDERKILNVVEEMAIAAGLPVPPVYLIDEQGINAFAAGYHQRDAVIGVTRGCIQQLTREELQGVMAHEFSHIFNGDMRLNIRLIGLLYGIMVIGLIGYFMMRSTMYSRRSKNGGGLVFLGLGLVVIGYGGTFFGNLIKAAVSRQREFLADASAVQFTRNPDGISGALKKIGGFKEGSKLNNGHASEISHMLFGEGISSGFMGLFATHPPLQERILRIDPAWQGKFTGVENGPGEASTGGGNSGNNSAGISSFSDGTLSNSTLSNSTLTDSTLTESTISKTTSAVDSIGNPSVAHLALAVQKIAEIPVSLHDEAHNSFGASALMYSLLIDDTDSDVTQKQLGILSEGLANQQYQAFANIHQKVKALPRDLYLPLIDISLPSLKQLSPTQYRTFMSHLSQLIVADEKISLFEWSLFKILRYNLDASSHRSARYVEIGKLAKSCEVLLSALAGAGHEDNQEREQAFISAAQLLNFSSPISFNPQFLNNTPALDKALIDIKNIKPLQKPLLLKAMVKCIDADGKVTALESELLRAVASLIDCPIPPLLSGQQFV